MSNQATVQPSPLSNRDTVRRYCIDAYATYYIFTQQVNHLRLLMKLMAFFGFVFPLLAGLAYTTYGKDSWFTTICVFAVGASGIVLSPLSLWALVDKWEDKMSYALKSSAENRAFYEQLHELLNDPTLDEPTIAERLKTISAAARERCRQDDEQSLSSKKKRKGHRAGLLQLRAPCAVCSEIPKRMNSTSCECCGQFDLWSKR